MESNFKVSDKKANYLFFASAILLVLSWVMDYLIDAWLVDVSIYQKLFSPNPLDMALHLFLFAIQLAILASAYFFYK
jgi:hypothetical protein